MQKIAHFYLFGKVLGSFAVMLRLIMYYSLLTLVFPCMMPHMEKPCPAQAARSTAARELGRAGEEAACAFLRNRGYRIVARNWRPAGVMSGLELDIVARDGKFLVFVEVKTRASGARIPVAAAFGAAKQKKMLAAARQYLAAEKAWHHACRFDLVCACGTGESGFQVEHYSNVIDDGQTLGGGNPPWQPW